MNIGDVPEAVVKRLSAYYRNVCRMEAEGFEKITSAMLAEKIGNTSVQVRQDFHICGGTEDYNIASLKKRLRELLGICGKHSMVVVGAGNLGRAIISYKDFEKDGFFIDAVFDNDLMYEGMRINEIPIMNIKLFEKYLESSETDIVIIAVPEKAAEEIYRKAVKCKVKGIWNFAPVDLQSIDGVQVRNVHLGDSLMTLSFRINETEYLKSTI